MMRNHRLIHRVEPHPYEDIVGFLVRVAERNHLAGPTAILEQVIGSASARVSPNHLPQLAFYCRNYLQELLQLSGLEQRKAGGDKAWQIAGEWVTKSSFVATRKVKVCPECLGEEPFIRGIWTLSFYTACHTHEIDLLEQCPSCKKVIKWGRRHIAHCGCGGELASAESIKATPRAIFISKLLARRSDPYISINTNILPPAEVNKLAELSVDGLCKTIWFLGHCVSDLGNYGTGHGRLQPRGNAANSIINKTIDLLRDWPGGVEVLLSHLLSQNPRLNIKQLEGLIRPVHNYLNDELQSDELKFLAAAYEQQIRLIWMTLGKAPPYLGVEKQTRFEF
jgi:hypothetical protein